MLLLRSKYTLIVSRGWVDAQFDPHEGLIGPYHVEDITTDTIANLHDYVTFGQTARVRTLGCPSP